MKTIQLNNGTSVPAVGIGTFLMEPEAAEKAVTTALRSGYTLVDTANAYMNEKAAGRAMRAAGVEREKLYLSTKLWPSVYEKAGQAIDETLVRLQTDYIDLLFLHQPVGDCIGAYKDMERAVRTGKVRSLGLSNFSVEQIQELMEVTSIVPAVLQVEAHPYYPETELRSCLEAYGIAIMAWYPLGHGDAEMLTERIICELADKHQKSAAQIILRWHVQCGNVVIPGSKDQAHIQDNINIFDFVLSDEDMGKIASIAKDKRYYTATKEALDGYLCFSPDFDAQQ